jgi:hypothetical protein
MGEDNIVDLEAFRERREEDSEFRDPLVYDALVELYGPDLHPWALYGAEQRFMARLEDAIENPSAVNPE